MSYDPDASQVIAWFVIVAVATAVLAGFVAGIYWLVF